MEGDLSCAIVHPTDGTIICRTIISNIGYN